MKEYTSLSEKYRTKGKGQLSKEEVKAYRIARMPATYTAVVQVLLEVKKKFTIESVLDVGAGLGAGLQAAKEIFEQIKKMTAIESNPWMAEEGKRWGGDWQLANAQEVAFSPHDLVLFSYSYGEMGDLGVLKRAFAAAKVLVIVEPGTPRGFSHVKEVRKNLIDWGGFVVAPCPHNDACPIIGDDWCHFSVRLPRTKEHKAAKGGALGWEDEKFSYVIVAKEAVEHAKGRVLRRPIKGSGHVKLRICTEAGIVDETITKKQKEPYKRARKVKWGDTFTS